jgi:hypothetical protein
MVNSINPVFSGLWKCNQYLPLGEIPVFKIFSEVFSEPEIKKEVQRRLLIKKEAV